jgi:hypothetical protein
LIEVKCPYSARGYQTLDHAIQDLSNFYIAKVVKDDGSIGYSLRIDTQRGFDYYNQIMLSLYITGLPYCHFYVWAPHFSQMIQIPMNQQWVDENESTLFSFWIQHVAPLIYEQNKQPCIESYMEQGEDESLPVKRGKFEW